VYHSDTYTLTLMTPNFSPQPMGLPRIPVSMAAVGPAMLHVAGEVCDGRHRPVRRRRHPRHDRQGHRGAVRRTRRHDHAADLAR
jgi:hypothetical protein